ncbi:MAG: glucose dehydrogenase [Chloroflexi bacterium]|nr:MAG: glucose dehydrogenase [Chloroflexota bacterium]
MKYKTLFLLLLVLPVAACIPRATEPITNTPPVVAEPTATLPSAPTTTPETVVEAPASPTAISTSPIENATAVPPTPTPTETPTSTPTPMPVQVNSISLKTIIPEGQLVRPTYLTHAFDNRLFIIEQVGKIRIVENGVLLAEPFLDLQDRVGSFANEQGLLGLAFHPEYVENGRFFVNYTNPGGSTVIARFQVNSGNPNLADPDSERILLTIGQPFNNHNGGQVGFGPDGFLYIAMGDGGSAEDPQNNGQNPATLLGSLLRIDVNYDDGTNFYAVPSTNPFVNDDAIRNEIWSYGWRNPWRFSFDRATGDLFVADVGQYTYEEVHFQPANSTGGENYGWNIMEGQHCFNAESCNSEGLQLPIFEYNHSSGCSITGGYVYRGTAFPSLTGNYFVGDYCTGIIWSVIPQADGSWTNTQVLFLEKQISSFGEDANGELYAVGHATGEVWQIQP